MLSLKSRQDVKEGVHLHVMLFSLCVHASFETSLMFSLIYDTSHC